MIKTVLILLLICVAIAYWKWALGLAIIWGCLQLFRAITKPGQSGSIPVSGRVKAPTGEYDAKTNFKMKHGYRQFVESQDADLLDLWPCQELIEIEVCEEPCSWPERWMQAGGKLYAGRMIARKDDPIWCAINRFGNPYPPFDFNSGMGVRDVRRDVAEKLGVLTRATIVKPIR